MLHRHTPSNHKSKKNNKKKDDNFLICKTQKAKRTDKPIVHMVKHVVACSCSCFMYEFASAPAEKLENDGLLLEPGPESADQGKQQASSKKITPRHPLYKLF